MRKIDRSAAFKKDIRREGKGENLATLNAILPGVLTALASDATLYTKYKDHKLTGDWEGSRVCHLKPDLLLIYEKPDDETLRLTRLGSHSELFGL